MFFCKFRLVAALLTLTAAGTALASCGTSAKTDSDTVAADEPGIASGSAAVSVTEPTEPDELDLRRQVDDELGDFDFGGKDFHVYISDYMEDYWIADAENGDVIQDAVYERNRAVEERFHVNIQTTQLLYDPLADLINKTVKAGDDIIDLISAHCLKMGSLATGDRFLNWYSIPHIDFSKPWWSPSTVRDLTYNNVCISAIGDAAMSAMTASYCVFYNKDLGASYGLPDVYQIIRDGQWTIDKITALSKDIYEDLNGNGESDNNDRYGYLSSAKSNINAYLWAFDNPIFRKEGEELRFVFKSEKIAEIVPKICRLFDTYPGIHTDRTYKDPVENSDQFYSRDMFAEGKCVFANGQINNALTHFRNLEDDYGILPYPKWDEQQEHYRTMADGYHEVLAVPITISDSERIGVITEALCAESYKNLVPAYYDVALKVKGVRDDESVEMLDLIVNSRIFDFGYVYDAWRGCSFVLEQLFGQSNVNFESFYAKKGKGYEKYYGKILKYFEEYDH